MEATENNEESHFFIIRVTIGREMQALERLQSQLARVNGIYSIVKPYSLKGYIIVEADSRESISNLIYNIKHIRGIMNKELSKDEALKTIEKKKQNIDINIGDVVKVLSGPFKGETATVKAVNKEKEELTVMFLESAVPINVNIKISDVSTIKSEGENK
ncbi:MAG: NusG antitermination factor [Candidatus Parvarchaeum acidiphilum ARMAN-4]|jgi:transcriptional antiterminator NusG|uniref:Transcription elongation factor Spt5 n=1 Tax=Candidatus Parvarchaeum acidiphilum ARMAN-4 TaxID=662760 RepID=D2EF56_PARA4|nr:MAG: NusG antitermination factor [Candidatus Parvarchaeum acidiphilum ARMAN-4]